MTLKARRRERFVERLSGDDNKWLNGYEDRWCFAKKKALWRAIHKTPNLKCAHFAKNRYGFRFMVVTNPTAIFNKLSIFAFPVYTSRSFSTYARFPKN